MEKTYINLNNTPYDVLHPILKNIYKQIGKKYDIVYINEVKNTSEKEVPKYYKVSGIRKIKIGILRFINKFVPRFNIIKDKISGKLITANNFLYTKNNYYVIATCLYQFSPRNVKTFYNPIFIKIFKYFFTRNNLKKVILLSKTAYDEFVLYAMKYLKLDENYIKSKIDYIYPFLVNNNIVTEDFIKERINSFDKVKFLFIARNFVGKGGIELIEAIENICKKYGNKLDFEINIISEISEKYLKKIENLKKKCININTYGINFTQEELEQKFYFKSHVLLHITRADLFGMVALESKKNGLAVITTDQYLNKELFQKDEACIVNIDKNYIWNDGLPKIPTESMENIEENILNIVQIEKCMIKLINDKKVLEKMSINNLKSLGRFTKDNVNKLFNLING